MERPRSVLLLVIALVAPPAVARAGQADAAFDAWNAAFLVTKNGDTYYATTVTTTDTKRSGTWVGALDIAVAEDTYERTHSAAHRQLVSDLVTTFIAKEGTDWKGDSWNDDIVWMVIAVLRGYQLTGNESFLTVATNAWNMAYDRGWDTKYGGGGVWEDMGHVVPWNQPSKCNLSNNPLIKMGLVLYQITGDATYLDKCKGMYAWIRKTLFDPTTGEIQECLAFKTVDDTAGFVQTSDNAYNSGSFLEAAEALYRVTGDEGYHQDALLAVTHRIAREPILHDGGQGERQWGYRFVKGLSELATFNDLWPTYQTWLMNNAAAAWSQRDALDVTWNDWTRTTPAPGAGGVTLDNDVVPLCTSSAAAIWQLFPPTTASNLSGRYEIRNAGSQLALAVAGASKAASAMVVQGTFAGGAEALWTFVPTAGGYYQIKNANSGLLLGVAGLVGKQGASLVQSADQGLRPGSDRWLPVANDDGTFTFYNLNSAMALDDPGGSTVAGTPLDQWAGNGTGAQRFELVAFAASGVDGAADGPVDAGAGGRDAAAAETAADGSAGAGTSGGAAGAGAGGTSGGAGARGGVTGETAASGGCSCATARGTSGPAGALALLALALGAAARRRRAR